MSPQAGLAVGEIQHDSPKAEELAKAFEYSVLLTRYRIKVDLTPSRHSAIYRFTFPQSDSANILIDLTHNIPMDIASFIGGKVTSGEVTIDTSGLFSVEGDGTYSGGFGDGNYQVFFRAEFNRRPSRHGTWINGKIHSDKTAERLGKPDDRVGAYLGFSTRDRDEIMMKLAVSFKSTEQAKKWLTQEIPDWNFESVKEKAKSSWNAALGRIEVEGGSDSLRTMFYTALYHAMLQPRDRTDDMTGYSEGTPL